MAFSTNQKSSKTWHVPHLFYSILIPLDFERFDNKERRRQKEWEAEKIEQVELKIIEDNERKVEEEHQKEMLTKRQKMKKGYRPTFVDNVQNPKNVDDVMFEKI